MKKLVTINLILAVSAILSLSILTSCSCDNSLYNDFKIENQSEQNLIIYLDGIHQGDVGPGKRITVEAPVDIGRYIVAALNTEGEVVFLKGVTCEELFSSDGHDKVIIPSSIPREGATSVDLVVENRSDMVLSVSVMHEPVGDIRPGESIVRRDLPHPSLPENERLSSRSIRSGPLGFPEALQKVNFSIDFHVAAVNDHGEDVFREFLDLRKLQIVDYKTLKVPIALICEKEITFRNMTDASVYVSVNFYDVGEIQSGDNITVSVPLYSDWVKIEAEDAQGRTVYENGRRYFGWQNMDAQARALRSQARYFGLISDDEKWEEVITSSDN